MNNENFDLENIQKLFKKLNIPDNYDPNKGMKFGKYIRFLKALQYSLNLFSYLNSLFLNKFSKFSFKMFSSLNHVEVL